MSDLQNKGDAYDSPWKEVLEHACPEFMVFYFPKAYAQIDWVQGHEFKNTDLRQVVCDVELGKRFADVLERLLVKRFGSLDEETCKRLGTATLEQLDLWADRILDASTIDAVFEGH